LLLSGQRAIILEIKLKHTPDAYFQLTNLYLPLLRRYFDRPGYSLACAEVCRWFDPWTAFPCRVRQLERLEDAKPDSFGVHIHNR
jgi:hypothetical protein